MFWKILSWTRRKEYGERRQPELFPNEYVSVIRENFDYVDNCLVFALIGVSVIIFLFLVYIHLMPQSN